MATDGVCLICSAPTNSQVKDSLAVNLSREKHFKISQRFLVQASRYLNIGDLPCFPSSQTITPTKDEDKFSCCDGCSTLVETYCNIYQQWNYLQLQLDWATGEIAEVMKESGTPKIPRNHLEKSLATFRSKFQDKVSQRRKSFPQLILEPVMPPQKNSQQDNFQNLPEMKEELPDSNWIESTIKNDISLNNNSPNVKAVNLKDKTSGQEANCLRRDFFGRALRTTSKRKISFKCRCCEEEFPRKKLQLNHEKISHGGKPYKCRFCEKRFSTRQILNFHEIIHSGQKPHKCQYCGKEFYWKHHKTQHEKRHKDIRRIIKKGRPKNLITPKNTNNFFKNQMRQM